MPLGNAAGMRLPAVESWPRWLHCSVCTMVLCTGSAKCSTNSVMGPLPVTAEAMQHPTNDTLQAADATMHSGRQERYIIKKVCLQGNLPGLYTIHSSKAARQDGHVLQNVVTCMYGHVCLALPVNGMTCAAGSSAGLCSSSRQAGCYTHADQGRHNHPKVNRR